MAAAVVLQACGGDVATGNTPPPNGGASATPLPTATATRPPPVAADLFPDLAAAGLERGPIEPIPGPAGFAIASAIYAGPTGSTRAEIRTYPSAAAARSDFPTQVAGWKAPPSGVFPIDPKNVDGPALVGPDESHAYVSSRADSSGNRIWTDIYRQGRVIVVAHTLARDEESAAEMRMAVAEGILALLR